jgi:hypothetical protein
MRFAGCGSGGCGSGGCGSGGCNPKASPKEDEAIVNDPARDTKEHVKVAFFLVAVGGIGVAIQQS